MIFVSDAGCRGLSELISCSTWPELVVDHDVRIGRLIIGAVQETVVTMVDTLLGFGPLRCSA